MSAAPRSVGIEPDFAARIPANLVAEYMIGRSDRAAGLPKMLTRQQDADPDNPDLVDAYLYGYDPTGEIVPLATGPRAITPEDLALIVAAYASRADRLAASLADTSTDLRDALEAATMILASFNAFPDDLPDVGFEYDLGAIVKRCDAALLAARRAK